MDCNDDDDLDVDVDGNEKMFFKFPTKKKTLNKNILLIIEMNQNDIYEPRQDCC